MRKFITCVSEDVPYVPITPDFLPKFRKNIDLIFSRDIIQKHHEEIKSEIENLLGKIDNEAELIRDDNLAKGEVVMVDTLTIRRESSEEKYWTIPIDKLLIPLSENDPAEYWGSFDMFGEDFISDIDRFPWMPVSVSKKIFVF